MDMSLNEAVSTMPDAVRVWVLWMTIITVIAMIAMLAFRGSRRDGLVVIVAMVAMVAMMLPLYAEVGFVRLLGLPHVIVWTPLVIYLFARWRRDRYHRIVRAVVAVFLLTLTASLVFDYIDVARYLLGETAPMTPAASG